MKLLETSKVFESKIRIQMIASLSSSDLTYPQLKRICQCSDGNMTTHTKKLIEEKFVSVEKKYIENKPTTIYHLTNHGRQEFTKYIEILKKLV